MTTATTKIKSKFECSVSSEAFRWHIAKIRKEVCRDLPCYGTIDEKDYCILHYPSLEKINDFSIELTKRINNNETNFEAVWFCGDEEDLKFFRNVEFKSIANFRYAHFDLPISFENAIFHSGADFGKASFWSADFTNSKFYSHLTLVKVNCKAELTFAKVKFSKDASARLYDSKFYSADFSNTEFFYVDFHKTEFSLNAHFTSTKFFGKASFYGASLSSPDFIFAEFHSYVTFSLSKLSFAHFKEVKFLDNSSFRNATFENITIFEDLEFLESDFDNTKFSQVRFTNVTFSRKLSFRWATFLDFTHFNKCTFRYANFHFAVFEENSRTVFEDVEFRGFIKDNREVFWLLVFSHTTFKGYFYFEGNEQNFVFTESISGNLGNLNLLDFQHSQIEKPERFTFHTVQLRPSWFIDIDTRKINFKNITWQNANGSNRSIQNELMLLDKTQVANPHNLLANACREIAFNYEENNNHGQASKFRRMGLETERLERKEKRKVWWADFCHIFKNCIKCSNFFSYSGTAIKNSWGLIKTFPSDVLHFLYRIFSGYGERWFRAFCWLIAIWLFWAFLYATPICDFMEKEKYSFSYWIGYSLNVITLQRPEPKPANAFTMIILGLEVLFAPTQAALLILAVRRKFMR